MRRQVVSLMFAGLVTSATPMIAATPVGEDVTAGTPAVAVQRVSLPDVGIRDEAAMVIVGTLLIGLAAVVRRAG